MNKIVDFITIDISGLFDISLKKYKFTVTML